MRLPGACDRAISSKIDLRFISIQRNLPSPPRQ